MCALTSSKNFKRAALRFLKLTLEEIVVAALPEGLTAIFNRDPNV
jgi:hypothetical protein